MKRAKKKAMQQQLSARGVSARAAEKFNQDVAKAGLEHYGPRTGEKFSYFRAVCIAVVLCTLMTTFPDWTMTNMLCTTAMLEHTRWSRARE